MDAAPFTIIESQEFLNQARTLMGTIRRWDDVMAGVQWALVRDPGAFPFAFEDRGVRVIRLWAPHSPAPLIRLFFTVDDQRVTFLWVEEVPPPELF